MVSAPPAIEGTNVSESATVPTARRQVGPPAHVEWLAGSGIALMLGAAALYVSALSRAVGVVLAVVGGSAVLGALAVRRRGMWPSRPWLVAAAALLIALVAYGGWLLTYSATHPPVAV